MMLSTVFGVGKLRFGSSISAALGVILFVGVDALSLPPYAHAALALVLLMVGFLSISPTHTDSKEIVVDEFVAMYVLLAIVGAQTPLMYALLFFAYRVVDILKPWPYSLLDKGGRFYILLDDLAIVVTLAAAYWLITL